MSDPLGVLSDEERGLLERARMPTSVVPMLATLSDDPFSDSGWIYERKLDGVRCIASRDGRGVRLRSRNDQRLDTAFPELCAGFETAARSRRVVADGEIVAFRGNVTSFSRLQGRIGIRDPDEARATGIAVHLYLFDVLHLDGRDTTALPQRARKRLLRAALRWTDPIRFTPHRNTDGETFLAESCRKGREGVIAKRADARYVHSRSRSWLKLKCSARQELVITGFTEPQGERHDFGALLLGYHEDGELRDAGRVGTGFDDDLLQRLGRRLRDRERETPPVANPPRSSRGVHWVRPDLVCEVAFTEWTRAGRLRHPRFLGLRTDKAASEVVRERPVRGGEG